MLNDLVRRTLSTNVLDLLIILQHFSVRYLPLEKIGLARGPSSPMHLPSQRSCSPEADTQTEEFPVSCRVRDSIGNILPCAASQQVFKRII